MDSLEVRPTFGCAWLCKRLSCELQCSSSSLLVGIIVRCTGVRWSGVSDPLLQAPSLRYDSCAPQVNPAVKLCKQALEEGMCVVLGMQSTGGGCFKRDAASQLHAAVGCKCYNKVAPFIKLEPFTLANMRTVHMHMCP